MRIVIVGGVAGGMSCAARARRLDEQVEIVVLERGEHVSFANCGLPYFVGGEIEFPETLLVQTPKSLKAAFNLDVRVRHEVVALDTDARTLTVRTDEGTEIVAYDALVLSPGARPIRPPLPGIESPRVHTMRSVADATTLRERVESGARSAVVLGAGFIGLEAAEALARQGLTVTLVELARHVLPPLEDELAWLVDQELQRMGIVVRSGVGAKAIESAADHDTVVLDDGSTVDADLVVLSVGVRPDTEVFERAGIACERGAIVVDEHGRTCVSGVWAVGDAVVSTDAVTGVRRPVALAGPANRAGRLVADDILRPELPRLETRRLETPRPETPRPETPRLETPRPEIPHPLGTAIVRVGGLTAAMTGASRAALRAREAAEVDFHTVHLHPNQHSGYFPGASPLHLIVHLRRGDGLLLGAQAVGTEGVDKRIDVLATAIRNQMTVPELVDLDLAYSPPYGQARDPVNLAGMLGANVLDGTIRLWYAQDVENVLDTALVLDTRSRAEFATGHLVGALNIPHNRLRSRLDEVRQAAAGRPVRAMCESGPRSYFAHRLLVQNGFDSATLSGGMLTLAAALGPRAADLITSVC